MHQRLSPGRTEIALVSKGLGIDKSRAAMKSRTKQTFVWSHLPLDLFLGTPTLKKKKKLNLNVALCAASIAALALMTAASSRNRLDGRCCSAADAAAAATDAGCFLPQRTPPTHAAPRRDAAAAANRPMSPLLRLIRGLPPAVALL